MMGSTTDSKRHDVRICGPMVYACWCRYCSVHGIDIMQQGHGGLTYSFKGCSIVRFTTKLATELFVWGRRAFNWRGGGGCR